MEDIQSAILQRNLDTDFDIQTKSGLSFSITIEAKLSMIDAKMRALLSGLGGAYCLLCSIDQDSACGRTEYPLETFFEINRDINQTKEYFLRLTDTEGNVKRAKEDYADRKGLP